MMKLHPSPLTAAHRRSQGQALVEFALIFPIFLLIVFGIIDIGRLVYINNSLAEGAREGARWGSVQGRSNSPGTVQAHVVGLINAVPSPSVTVTCQDPSGAPAATCRSGYILTVSISSTVGLFTPVIGQLVGNPTYTATSKVTVNQ